MELLDRIEDQVAATGLPLFAITVAAVPCPDTPVILTLHWHGFIKEKLADVQEADVVSYTPVPSSALQLNERWKDLVAVDRAAMDAAWELGAWERCTFLSLKICLMSILLEFTIRMSNKRKF